eukprot:GDKI01033455.1.p1 GENE.GDKI01033455.1~~GDKI01033455.1.p1  ORF type:complete len:428 (+),score=89.16 GDKI01033455.1:98-1381(+)
MSPGALERFFHASRPHELWNVMLVHVNIALYAMCYWLCQPVLPFLLKQMGADAVVYGYLQTTFSLMQLIGGPYIGRLSDTKGAKFTLILTQISACVGYFLLACAGGVHVYGGGMGGVGVWLLFGSRLPSVFLHCMQVAQAFISRLASADNRTAALGRLSLSYGVGMAAGSTLGGILSDHITPLGVVCVSCLLTLATCVFDFFALPNIDSARAFADQSRNESEKIDDKKSTSVWGLLKVEGVFPIFVFQLVFGMALGIQQSTFSMAMPDRFGMHASGLGLVMTLISVLGVINNTFIVGWAVQRFTDRHVLQFAVGTLCFCFAGYAYISTVPSLVALLVPMSIASGASYTVTTSLLTQITPPSLHGSSIALSHATRAACGMLAPTIGGYLLKTLGYSSIGLTCVCVCALSLAFLFAALHPPHAHTRKFE